MGLKNTIRLGLATLLLAPLAVGAAGLGRLSVNSALGQPLSAEIEIVSLQPGEEDSLAARLASQQAFQQAGIELTPSLLGVQFAIVKRDGRPVLRLTSSQPVNEPFLDMLVELSWNTGRLVREYTFLLDPPEYRRPAVAATPAPPPAAAAVPAQPAPRAEPLKPAPRDTRPAPVASAGAKQQEVKKGDTLAKIARDNKPEGVSLNQMLIALYRANQDAFINGNMNLIRTGKILNIPEREAAAGIDAAEANRLVQGQMAEFSKYRQQLGAAVAATPAAPAAREREVSGKIATKPEAPAPAEQKDQLKLSKADPAKPGAASSKAAREDDKVARDRALKEAQSRTTELEKNVADLQKLLEMKNQQLAQLEKKGAPAAPAPAPKAPEPAKAEAKKDAPKAEAPKDAPKTEAPKAAEAPKGGEAPKAEAPKAEAPKGDAPKADAPKAEAPKAEAKKDEPKKDAGKPAEKKKATPVKAAPEKSFIEEFMEDPVALGGLGAVILALGGYGAWAWRRKKKAHASTSQFQDSVLGAAAGGSVFNSAAAADEPVAVGAATPAPAADSSAAPVSGSSVGAAESDEVDPIAEADVYMAYGRDAQAEEILREALAKDASRLPVHMKLLEIYANRKDKATFEKTALQVKSLTNGEGADWDKAMALGHGIDPENGLYGTGGSGAAEVAAAPAVAGGPATLDFDIGGGDAPAVSAGEEKKPEPATLDFDLGSPAEEKKGGDFTPEGTLVVNASELKTESPGLDLDLGLDLGGDKKDEPAQAKAVDPDATIAMDFDLNLDLGTSKAEAKPADAPLDLGGLTLDLGTPSEAPAASGDAKWQEVATKLDLAKAYQEMGDKDGARELLNEVLRDGDSAQKAQAEQMLSALG